MDFQTIQLTPTSISPADLYAQWETELGVSGTLANLDGDDSNWTFDLASPALVAGASHGEFSSEGMLGWSGSPKAGNTVQTNFNRMYYAGGVQPDMLLGFRFNGDMGSFNVKLQKAAGDTIIGGYIQRYTGSGQKLFFAIRLSATLATPPVFCVRVEPGDLTAYVSGLRIAPGTQNFSSLPVPPGTTGFVEFGSHPIGVVSRGVSALRRDIEFGGRGVITGTVKVKGTPNVPTKRRVRLLRDRGFLLVRETWSDPVTGAYAFHEIDERYTYTVIADDYEGNFRAVLADRVVPEVMQ